MNPYKFKLVRAVAFAPLLFAAAACGGQEAGETADASPSEAASVEEAATEASDEAMEAAKEALSAAEEEAADAVENTEPDTDEMLKAASAVAESAGDKVANVTNDALDAGEAVVTAAVADASDMVEAVETAAQDTAAAVSGVLDGDATAGKRAFVKCMACHTVNEGQHRVGPSLYNIMGKKAGTVEGFRNYSPANKDSGVTWTPEVMFEYLENPQQFMPGTRMVFPGIPSEKERADLIAYLQSVSE